MAAGVANALPTSQLRALSDLQHYMPSKEPFWEKDRRQSYCSEEAESPNFPFGQNNTSSSYFCTQKPGGTYEESSSNTNRKVVATGSPGQTQIEDPGATTEPTEWITPSRRRTKKSSNILTANRTAKPSAATAPKEANTVWRADGEKEGKMSMCDVKCQIKIITPSLFSSAEILSRPFPPFSPFIRCVPKIVNVDYYLHHV